MFCTSIGVILFRFNVILHRSHTRFSNSYQFEKNFCNFEDAFVHTTILTIETKRDTVCYLSLECGSKLKKERNVQKKLFIQLIIEKSQQ